MKKYFIALLIVTLHIHAMKNVGDDIKKEIILQTAEDFDYKQSIKTVRSLALVNKNFNQLINDKEVTKRLIEIIGSCKALATFKKNQKKTETSDNSSSSSGFTNFCSNTETLSVPSEFYEKNQPIYNIIAALRLSTPGSKEWFEKKYPTKEDKQDLLKFMAGQHLLKDKIAPLCGGIPSFNEQASLINDDLVSLIKFSKHFNCQESKIVLGTARALHGFDILKIKDDFKYFADTPLLKQAARWLKREGKVECIKEKLEIEIDQNTIITNDTKTEHLKRIRFLLKIIKDTIPENNTYLSQALHNSEIVKIITDVLDENRYNIKALNLENLIIHNYLNLFNKYIKTPEFNIKKFDIYDLKKAEKYNRQDMFLSLLTIIVDKKQTTKKQLPFKDIIFTAIEAQNDFFFNKLLEHELFYTNFTKQTPLQHAVLKGKLNRASKILEKITQPDPEALNLAQKFSYNEFVEKYNNKKFVDPKIPEKTTKLRSSNDNDINNNNNNSKRKNDPSDKRKRKSDCCIF